jgi:hypothetical protein
MGLGKRWRRMSLRLCLTGPKVRLERGEINGWGFISNERPDWVMSLNLNKEYLD